MHELVGSTALELQKLTVACRYCYSAFPARARPAVKLHLDTRSRLPVRLPAAIRGLGLVSLLLYTRMDTRRVGGEVCGVMVDAGHSRSVVG